ncbi:hypothetical protein MUK42_36065 [Musa troglodytarum]|uniref:Uncharacterized protein n=1 Tax=Musa troglodytarum TaxID=320322 RepID=A0A9E7HIL4_9LILI|nr:hypothetical protein MUK42_36065 [Musa troglodytarum]
MRKMRIRRRQMKILILTQTNCLELHGAHVSDDSPCRDALIFSHRRPPNDIHNPSVVA